MPVTVDAEYLRDVEGARRDLRDLIIAKQCAPIMLRLSFHDAGTYDKNTNTGGVNGSVRFELSNPANGGIKVATDFCEEVKAKHPKISYADLYQLAGVVAVEVTGGPIIPFIPGRVDAPQGTQDGGALPVPTGDAAHLRTIFYRLGLNDRDIVVLSGAHTLGRAHKDRSNFDGNLSKNPMTFDNDYFAELLRGDNTPGVIKMPSDMALMADETFRRYVQLYAKDQNAFFQHYAESHKKMSELGFATQCHA